MHRRLTAIAIAVTIGVSCGGDTVEDQGDAGSCEGECLLAPAPICDGDEVVRFSSLGECVAGACQHAVIESSACEFGCRDGSCLADPCLNVRCNDPPAASCDGDVAESYRRQGSCSAGVCNYEQQRTDCSTFGSVCLDGTCVGIDLCEGVTCDAPPASVCEGGQLRTWSAAGACDNGTCSYDTIVVACGAGEICESGACVVDPQCVGVSCDTPPAEYCADGASHGFEAVGRCLAGLCVYDETVTDCVATGLECRDGACRRDPCRDISCANPPRAACEAATAVTWAPVGACREGECDYTATRIDCAALGRRCQSGACVDACGGVVCTTPPAPACEGDVAVVPTPSGVCVAGGCVYGERRTDCADSSLRCLGGACFDPCEGLTCESPPAPTCVDASSRRFWGAVACTDGACDYGAGVLERCRPGETCAAGACVPAACISANDCEPSPFCEGSVAVSFAGAAACVDGRCDAAFSELRRNCASEGARCALGTCVPEPCTGVACDSPPPATCDGADAVTYATGGTCAGGVCTYEPLVETCATSCWDGACFDGNPCDGVSCATPPAARCEDGVAVSFEPGGTCESGGCSFVERRETCDDSGRFCDAGRCEEVDPCAVVVCGATPDPVCDGGDLVTFSGAGACVDGVCAFAEDRSACPFGCNEGSCASSDACLVIDCAEPAPICDGNTRVTWVDGQCTAGECTWRETRFPCGLESARCVEGACVPVGDVCSALDCGSVPDARCVDPATAVRYTDGGVCDADAGACDLTDSEVAETCVGETQCYDGACRRSPRAGDLVISELYAWPSAGRSSDQWFEVAVAATEALDLAGLTLRDGTGRTFVVEASLVVAPGDRVVFGGGVASPPAGPDVVWNAITFGLAAEDQLLLSHGSTEIDRVVYGASDWPVVNDRSLVLTASPTALANDDAAAWCVSDDVYDPITDRRGTPGEAAFTCAAAPCDPAECNAPPAPVCENAFSVREFGAAICDELGACDYMSNATIRPCSIETGERCEAGVCVTPSCSDSADCVAAPFCFGGNAFAPGGPVPCSAGACDWAAAFVIDICADRGATCVDGVCTSP